VKKIYFIFGASSFVARELIKNFQKKVKVIAFTHKKQFCNNKNIFFINYKKNSFLKKIDSNIYKLKPICIFANAISDDKIFIKLSEKSLNKIIEVNQKIPFIITQKILKKYTFNKPSFIYLSSSRGFIGVKGAAIYSATKNALEGFARSMAMEYGNLGANFRVIRLGLCKGGLKDNFIKKKDKKKILDQTCNNKYINVKELNNLINFISDDTASNGSSIKCDNGYF